MKGLNCTLAETGSELFHIYLWCQTLFMILFQMIHQKLS